MKRNFKTGRKAALFLFTIALAVTSCSDDTSVFDTPIDGGEEGDGEATVATLVINEEDASGDILTAEATGEIGSTVSGRISYTSTTTQRRLYITENVSGSGDMPFSGFSKGDDDILDKELNADGSIDLDGDTRKNLDFTFDLPAPTIADGSIVYSFWTTTGKGDFRDPTKRKALGVGSITVTVGTGTNPTAEVREFTDVKLFAPLLDGKSETFFSLLNETVYKVYEGPEYRAFWDFGYYYVQQKAHFASSATYSDSFGFEVAGLVAGSDEEDADNETLNEAFFALSTKTTTEFDAIENSSELDYIIKSDSQNISNLLVDNIVEFEDNYGKKGLIKITAITGTYNSTDYIKFDVKLQP